MSLTLAGDLFDQNYLFSFPVWSIRKACFIQNVSQKFEMLKKEPQRASQYQTTISAGPNFLLFSELRVASFVRRS